MKRKDWKIKNLKKGIFGKNFLLKSKSIRERFLFLRKLFLRQNKYLIRKNLFVNFYMYRLLFNLYKLKKQQYYFNLFWKTNSKNFCFLPAYSITKNIFNKKIQFKKLKKNYNLNFIFLPNKITKNWFGLNYYILNKESNKIFLDFKKELLNDDYSNLIFFKNYNLLNKDIYNFNYYLNYNIHNECLLEMYKIIILINLKLFEN